MTVVPAKAGTHTLCTIETAGVMVPAFAGTTNYNARKNINSVSL